MTNKLILCIICMLMAAFSIQARKPLRIALVDVCGKQSTTAPRTYVEAVLKGGHVPYVIPRMPAGPALRQLVSLADVVLFLGGEDVNPSCYNAVPSPQLGAINQRRDSFEFCVADEAVAQKKPMMGICRGQQFINVYFGGTLIQHLPTRQTHAAPEGERESFHPASAVPGSFAETLYGATQTVNSSHHQATDRFGSGLHAAQYAADGTVEAAFHETLPIWSVQWHPERTCFDFAKEGVADGSLLLRFFLHQCE